MADYSPAGDANTGTLVFLFGAGCSADGDAPVMRAFMGKAREYARDPRCPFKAEYAQLHKFRQECLRICYVFDRWWENIEDLYTQAQLGHLLGMPEAASLCECLQKVIWDVYRRPCNGHGYQLFHSTLQQIVNRWREGISMRPVIVTTNYDVLFEAIARRDSSGHLPMKFCYPGDLQLDDKSVFEANRTPAEVESGGYVEVIKLHGSVNWLMEDSSGQAKGYVRGQGERFAFQNEEIMMRYVQRNEMHPLIVPPTLGKLSTSDLIAANWNRAVRALESARCIVIAGYSFPESDSFMTRLLAEGIKRNDHLEQMFIINNDADAEWRSQVERMFTKSWMKNNVAWIKGTFGDATGALDRCEQFLPQFDLDSQRALLRLRKWALGRGPSLSQQFRIENRGLHDLIDN